MDRTTWIALGLCAVLLGADYYYNSTRPAPVQTTTVTSPQSQQTAPQASSGGAGLTVLPPVDTTKVETWEMATYLPEDDKGTKKKVATFSISNIGGAIRNVEMNGTAIDSFHLPDHSVKINEEGTYGIGALAFGISPAADPLIDTAVYKKIDSMSNESKLTLAATLPNGLAVQKEYFFDPPKDDDGVPLTGGKYMIKLRVTIENPLKNPVRIPDMGVLAGAGYPIAKSEMSDAFTHFFYMADGDYTEETPSYFTGGWFTSTKAREVKSVEDMTFGGVMSQYYASILMPDEQSRGTSYYAREYPFYLSHEGNKEVRGVVFAMGMPVIDLQPGQQKTLSYDIYTGPKENQVLNKMPYSVDKIMAYGFFAFLSDPMNWLLNFFFKWVGNWGIAIICMTIVVRLIIWPLYKKSYMSMKQMSLLQPKMQELKEKYPDDPQKMNMEMMKLYQEYGINPMGGCLPLLIQLPIFLAFYRVLQYSAELRGQPFFGWMRDLSLPDTVFEIPLPFNAFPSLPINILPIIMAITMIIQMKMTPQAGDKMQRRIMAFMPWIFFLFCYNFASALALYWTAQNLINMVQTLLIRRLPQPELTKNKKKKKNGLMQRLMEQQRILAEQQRQQAGMRNVTPGKKR